MGGGPLFPQRSKGRLEFSEDVADNYLYALADMGRQVLLYLYPGCGV